MVISSTNNNATIITLSPNRSASWKDVKLCLLFISLPALIIAMAWLYMGVWIILLFCVIEIGLLSYFMYRVCYQNYRKELITITEDNVVLSCGVNKENSKHIFHRPDCYLLSAPPPSPRDKLELSLASESCSLTIGEFLSPIDCERARRTLRNAGLIECSKRWWKSH